MLIPCLERRGCTGQRTSLRELFLREALGGWANLRFHLAGLTEIANGHRSSRAESRDYLAFALQVPPRLGSGRPVVETQCANNIDRPPYQRLIAPRLNTWV